MDPNALGILCGGLLAVVASYFIGYANGQSELLGLIKAGKLDRIEWKRDPRIEDPARTSEWESEKR